VALPGNKPSPHKPADKSLSQLMVTRWERGTPGAVTYLRAEGRRQRKEEEHPTELTVWQAAASPALHKGG